MNTTSPYFYGIAAFICLILGYLIRPVFDPYPVTTGTTTTVTSNTTSNTTAKIDTQKIINDALIELSPKLKEYYVTSDGEWLPRPEKVRWIKTSEVDSIPVYIEVPTFQAEVYDSTFIQNGSRYSFSLVKDGQGNFKFNTARMLTINHDVVDTDTTIHTVQKFNFSDGYTYNMATKKGTFHFKDLSEIQIPVVKQIITNTITIEKETLVEKPKGVFDYIKLGVGVGTIVPIKEGQKWELTPLIGIFFSIP